MIPTLIEIKIILSDGDSEECITIAASLLSLPNKELVIKALMNQIDKEIKKCLTY